MNHSDLKVQPIGVADEARFQQLMQAHHFLGALRKIGNTLRYVASVDNEWLALLSCSAPALCCRARDDWIGWSYRHRTDRLKLIANNSRYALFPVMCCSSGKFL